MTSINPDFEGSGSLLKDIYYIFPSIVGMTPISFWVIEFILGLIIIWVVFFSGWLL